ncbi:BHH_G0034390.mRNA.1.CDS.1 [Saccharomyces cerevisiae]|nr:BHH_G0034390.mRNA.1.CDS.1 [Saccharomyces cerevisiae]CAI7217398.1 BHH_G0034390.mRNA.1.CDS.1 [Saccharomyces cerevisiae]
MDLRLGLRLAYNFFRSRKDQYNKSYKLHFLIRYTTSPFEVKEPTTLYHHYHHRHLPHSPSLLLICHTHTDATVYTISNLPYFHIPHHGPILTKSVLDALTSLCTALASAVYTLCHSPITPIIIHILISTSHFAVPNIV